MIEIEERQAKNDNGVRDWLGILIVAVPAIGYLVAFVYQEAYCNYFAIPAEFIVLDWTMILLSLGIVLAASFIFLYVIFLPILVAIVSRKRLGPIQKRIWFDIAMLIFLLLTWLLYFGQWLILLTLVGLWGGFVLVDFLAPLITQRDKKGYVSKLEAQDKKDQKNFPAILARTPRNIIRMSLAILIILAISYAEGTKAASTQTIFMVPSTKLNYIVLRTYNDNIICAPYVNGINGNQTKREFAILNLKELTDTVLFLQSVGPMNR